MSRKTSWRLSRRRTRSTVSLVAAVATLSVVLAACGGDDDDEGGTGSDETKVLTVWASREYYIPPDKFKSLMEEHPDIEIKYDVMDQDDILQQMQRMQQAGQDLPDVIQDDVFLTEAFKEANLIQPIDDQMAAWEEGNPDLWKEMLPTAFDEAEIDGEHYGMTVTANFDVLYYNTQWFEEAGVEPTFETYEDLYDAAEQLKQARPDQVPFSVQALAGEGVTGFKNVLIGTGTPFEGATPDLTSPGAQYAMGWFIDLQKAGLLPPEAISWGEAESRGAFIKGDAGLLIDGFTTSGDFNDVGGFDYEKDWGITLLPINIGQGDVGSRPSSARFWGVSSTTKYPEDAGLVLQYIADTPQLIGQAEQGGVPMRQTAALNDPKLTEIWPFFSPEVKQAYIDSTPVPSALNAGDVEDVLEQLFGEIVQGTDETPEELAEKYQPQLDALG